jgi:sorbitol/mannitol transport system substrate-binding protein
MIRMQRLARAFTQDNPDIALDWVTMGEGELRRTVGTDIALGGGRFDVLTLGTYEVPIWGRRGWLVPLDDLPEDYGVEDLLPGVRDGLSVEGTLFAVPFYGESSFTMVRTDLLDRAGLTLPEAPAWDDIRALAQALHDPEAGVHGICLRGKPGWGENMALVGAMANRWARDGSTRTGAPSSTAPNGGPRSTFTSISWRWRRPAPRSTASTRPWRCSSGGAAACGSTRRWRPRR